MPSLDNLDRGQARPAEEVKVSLSQAILAPLDALYKAQVHAARSFLNFVLQLGYPDTNATVPGNTDSPDNREAPPYDVPFTYTTLDAQNRPTRHTVRVPTLSLVPLMPLGVESAEVKLKFRIVDIGKHRQFRKSVSREQQSADPKWYLVDEPLSLQGHFAPQNSDEEKSGEEAVVDISVKLSRVPTPEVLQRTLSMLGNSAYTDSKTG